MTILAVGAHPDDIEFMCAGTLAKYAKRGDKIVMAIVTNGEIGDLPPLTVPLVKLESTAMVSGAGGR